MELPSAFLTGSFVEKNIYYFTNIDFENKEPHHFILVKRREGGILILSCCTTKWETVHKFVTSRKFPEETMVTIPKGTEGTELKKHTYINCNEYFEYTVEQFEALYNSGKVKSTGVLPGEHYLKIIAGMIASPEVEEELKDELAAIL